MYISMQVSAKNFLINWLSDTISVNGVGNEEVTMNSGYTPILQLYTIHVGATASCGHKCDQLLLKIPAHSTIGCLICDFVK